MCVYTYIYIYIYTYTQIFIICMNCVTIVSIIRIICNNELLLRLRRICQMNGSCPYAWANNLDSFVYNVISFSWNCKPKIYKHALLLLLRLRWWCALICIWTVAMIMKCMGSSWNCMWFAVIIMELHWCSLILSGLDEFWWVDGSEND